MIRLALLTIIYFPFNIWYSIVEECQLQIVISIACLNKSFQILHRAHINTPCIPKLAYFSIDFSRILFFKTFFAAKSFE